MIKYIAHHCRNTKNGTCNNIWIDKDITNAKTVAPSWKYCAECCKKLGIDRVLMVCDKSNIGSAKSIIKNGGILENEFVDEDGEIEQRYWIELS